MLTKTSQLTANAGGYRAESFDCLRANPNSAPIVVTCYHNGRNGVTDGRHRLALALERGAKTITAEVWKMGPRGGVKRLGIRTLEVDGAPKAL